MSLLTDALGRFGNDTDDDTKHKIERLLDQDNSIKYTLKNLLDGTAQVNKITNTIITNKKLNYTPLEYQRMAGFFNKYNNIDDSDFKNYYISSMSPYGNRKEMKRIGDYKANVHNNIILIGGKNVVNKINGDNTENVIKKDFSISEKLYLTQPNERKIDRLGRTIYLNSLDDIKENFSLIGYSIAFKEDVNIKNGVIYFNKYKTSEIDFISLIFFNKEVENGFYVDYNIYRLDFELPANFNTSTTQQTEEQSTQQNEYYLYPVLVTLDPKDRNEVKSAITEFYARIDSVNNKVVNKKIYTQYLPDRKHVNKIKNKLNQFLFVVTGEDLAIQEPSFASTTKIPWISGTDVIDVYHGNNKNYVKYDLKIYGYIVGREGDPNCNDSLIYENKLKQIPDVVLDLIYETQDHSSGSGSNNYSRHTDYNSYYKQEHGNGNGSGFKYIAENIKKYNENDNINPEDIIYELSCEVYHNGVSSYGNESGGASYFENNKIEGKQLEIPKTNKSWTTIDLSEEGYNYLITCEQKVNYFYLDEPGNLTWGIGFTNCIGEKVKEVWTGLDNYLKTHKIKNGNVTIEYSIVDHGGHKRLSKKETTERTGEAPSIITINEINKKDHPDAFKDANKFLKEYVIEDKFIKEQFSKCIGQYIRNAAVRFRKVVPEFNSMFSSISSDIAYKNQITKWKNSGGPIASKLTQEQYDLFINMAFNGDPGGSEKEGTTGFFSFLEESNPINTISNATDKYKKFCELVIEAIDNAGTNKTTGIKTGVPRSNSFREKVKAAFDPNKVSTSNSIEEADYNKYIISKIEITCISNAGLKVSKRLSCLYDMDGKEIEGNQLDTSKPYEKKISIFNNVETIEKKYHECYFMDVICTQEPTTVEEMSQKSSRVQMEEIAQSLNEWLATNNFKKPEEQLLINVDKYYDFYSGMTPYIEAYFRDTYTMVEDKENNTRYRSYNWNMIDSVHHPYFKSLTVEDTGVKTITLTLFDKDFASYQYGILFNKDYERDSKTDSKKRVYSLETLIKQALKPDTPDHTEEKVEANNSYEPLSANNSLLPENYIKLNNDLNEMICENLMIRYGYCDRNQRMRRKISETEIEKTDQKLINYMNNKYKEAGRNGEDPSNQRNYRWWDVKTEKTEGAFSVTKDFKITGNTREKVETAIELNNSLNVKNDIGSSVAETMKWNSPDQTTVMSYQKKYMIIGYNTTLRANGIEYTIKAIESVNVNIYRKRFLQRYAEITSYPLDVLYILERIFNSNQYGEVRDNSIPKILFMPDVDDESKDILKCFNMQIDLKSLSEEEASKFKSDNTVENNDNNDIKPEMLKKITLKLGGESALRNYKIGERALYKTVANLLDDFCNACPPKPIKSNNDNKSKKFDINGEEVETCETGRYAPLKWFLVTSKKSEDGKGDDVSHEYIVLYYRKPVMIPKIKRYIWGPNNPYKSIVKDLSIQNQNEFAVLSGVSTFDNNLKKMNLKVNAKNVENQSSYVTFIETPKELGDTTSGKNYTKHLLNDGAVRPLNAIPTNTEEGWRYNDAYANSMYNGTMTILGDPGLEFNTTLQPYTYPIRLDVLVPNNELTFKDIMDPEENNDYKEKLENVSKNYGAQYILGNQRLHETSGYYVITKITHNISASGYTTTLEITSYPNIERDILKNPGTPLKTV